MRKFFCNYNNLTEQYELAINKNNLFSPKINIQAENSMLEDIKDNIQILYELTVRLKELINNNDILAILDETELLISNLYYSLFASPLELVGNINNESSIKNLFTKAIEIASFLEKKINIPEYNRLSSIIKNNFQNILNNLLVLPSPNNSNQTKTPTQINPSIPSQPYSSEIN